MRSVFEAKFMLSWSFSEEAAAEKYMPQLQHNMSSQNPLRAGCARSPQTAGESTILLHWAADASNPGPRVALLISPKNTTLT